MKNLNNKLIELENLKLKIKDLINKKIKYKDFDKWLTKEYIKENKSKFYSAIIYDLFIELEGLQVEFIESSKIKNKEKVIDHIKFSKTFIKEILDKIETYIKFKYENETN